MSFDLTRRGLIRGIIASVASTALVVKATPSETALVKTGAPVDVLTPSDPKWLAEAAEVLPTLYVKTADGSFEPFAQTTELNFSAQRIDVTNHFGADFGAATYVQGLRDVEGSFVVLGSVTRQLGPDGKRYWGRGR